jgi:hypothetical protein
VAIAGCILRTGALWDLRASVVAARSERATTATASEIAILLRPMLNRRKTATAQYCLPTNIVRFWSAEKIDCSCCFLNGTHSAKWNP